MKNNQKLLKKFKTQFKFLLRSNMNLKKFKKRRKEQWKLSKSLKNRCLNRISLYKLQKHKQKMQKNKRLWLNRKLFYGRRRLKIPKFVQPSNKLKVRAFLDFILSKWKSKDLKLTLFIRKLNKCYKIQLNLLKSQYVLLRKLKKWPKK